MLLLSFHCQNYFEKWKDRKGIVLNYEKLFDVECHENILIFQILSIIQVQNTIKMFVYQILLILGDLNHFFIKNIC